MNEGFKSMRPDGILQSYKIDARTIQSGDLREEIKLDHWLQKKNQDVHITTRIMYKSCHWATLLM